MKAINLIAIVSAAAVLLLAASCNKPDADKTAAAGTSPVAAGEQGNAIADNQAAGNEMSGSEPDSAGGGSETDGAAGARRMPEFSVRSSAGEVLPVTSFYGKPLVINFWGDWCPPCINELPALNEVYKERKAEFDMLAISVDSQAAEDFWKQNGYEIPMYHSVDAKENLGLMAYPATFFLDGSGSVVGYVTGEMSREDFEARLATILR